MRNDLLRNIVVVLDHPQNLVNIAGVIRAMKNMGLSRLRLVEPAEFDPWRIDGIAHRSGDVIEATERFDTLEEAVVDSVFVVGTTARARTAHRNYVRPRDVAPGLISRAEEGAVALVFGREDRGLTNEGLDLCDVVTVIPTAPDYSSMNLAQASLLLVYEVFLAAGGAEQPLPRGKRSERLATREEMESMLSAIQDGLARIEFFNARAPESVMRTFRTLLARAEPDQQEAGLVRAMGFEIGNYLDRVVGDGKAAGPNGAEES